MKILLSFSLLTLILFSCKKEKYTCESADFSRENIQRSALYGAGDENISEQNLVITSDKEWKNLLNKMNSVNDESSQFSKTEIDFDTQMIIACFDPVRSNGGFSLSIDTVYHNGNQINVEIVRTDASAGGGLTTQVITQPYEIIAVTRCDDPVVFN